MDAAIYARLSKKRKTPGNPEGLSENVQIQIAEARAYSGEKTWPVVGTFSDDDISASKYSKKPRPGYERLVAAIEAGQVQVIICTEMTRLYRRMEELLELIKMAERTRLRAIWTTDDVGYDLSTPEGIHQAIGAVNNAMLESAKLSKRLKRKKAEQARQGNRSGGGRPFGYEDDGMTIRQSEADLLIEAKNRYLAGETVRDIVRDFYRRGIVSPYGKPWYIENFQRVLFSKRYIGVLTHNGGDEYPALWPALWTEAEWNLMDARRRERAAKYPGRGRGVGRQYLLTGLLECGRCGQPMVGSRRARANDRVRRYRCKGVDNHGLKVGCGKVFRMTEPLDLFVTDAVLYRYDTPEVARLLAEDEPDHTEALITEYQAAKLQLDRMVADYASGFLNRDEFKVAKLVAEGNLQRARNALSQYQTRQARILIPARDNLRDAWEAGGLDWRRDVIKLLVVRIVIQPGHPGAQTWRGWRFDPNLVEIEWRV